MFCVSTFTDIPFEIIIIGLLQCTTGARARGVSVADQQVRKVRLDMLDFWQPAPHAEHQSSLSQGL